MPQPQLVWSDEEPPVHREPEPAGEPRGRMARAGLACGIVGLALVWVPLLVWAPLLGLILGVVATVFGGVAMGGRPESRVAVPALVVGIVACSCALWVLAGDLSEEPRSWDQSSDDSDSIFDIGKPAD